MSPASPYCLICSKENQPPRQIDLKIGEFLIGRSSECNLILDDHEVSRRHARIYIQEDGQVILSDQGSANGTQLEGKPLAPRQEVFIRAGQYFQIGPYRMALLKTAAEPARPPLPEEAKQSTPVGVQPIFSAEDRTVDAIRGLQTTPEMQLVILIDGVVSRSMQLPDGTYLLGRESKCDIHLDDPFISRKHAWLHVKDGCVQITDPGSSNGVTINGIRLPANQPKILQPGEGFEIGKFSFRFEMISPIASAVPQGTAEGVKVVHAEAGRRLDSKPINLMGLEKISIGRADDNHIVINHPMVSRYHALIERMGTRYRIIDTHSANGVYVNGQRIVETGWLKEGDEIKIGLYQFKFTGTMIQQSSAEGYTIDVLGLKKFVTKTLNLLQDINLHIGQNEFVALVGMSGSGKTTLQDAVNGYRPATHGQVLVNNINLYQNYDMFRSDIGYVPQRDIVHMELTPESSLDYAAQLRMPVDTTPAERKQAVHQTLKDLGLLERKDVPNSRLSGGQLKRVSIGAELLTRPKLFFLDEPTSGLDPGTEYEMMKLLRRLADQGRTIMLITHATKNVMLCDKVIILAKGGYLAYFGAPENALTYFNQYRSKREQLEKDMEFDDIYRVLEDPAKGTPSEWGQRFRDESARLACSPVPAAGLAEKKQKSKIKQVSALKQFLILSSRNTKILLKDRVSLAMLLALAPLLGFFNIVWGSRLFDPVDGDVSRGMGMWFMTAVIAVLVGSMSSIREIVKETDIYKRERAVGLKVLPYTLSKLWIGAILSVYAGIVILLFIVVIVHPTMPNFQGYISLWITLALGIFAGYLMGLLISALVPNQNSAMILLIAVLVPQFLLAGVLIPLENVPLGRPLSSVVITRWTFEAFVRSTGIGDPLVNDPCWQLDKNDRLAMTEEQKSGCTCLGANIFERCSEIPGILSADFYDTDARAALAQAGPIKPVEPAVIPSPTAIPSPTPFPSPSPYPTPTSLPLNQDMQSYMAAVSAQQQEYFDGRIGQLNDYQNQIKDVTGIWADEQSAQMETYAWESQDQYEAYADEMELYSDEMADWEKERQSAIGAAESLLNTIYENYGRSFRKTVAYRWRVLGLICLAEYAAIVVFIRRKDVV